MSSLRPLYLTDRGQDGDKEEDADDLYKLMVSFLKPSLTLHTAVSVSNMFLHGIFNILRLNYFTVYFRLQNNPTV